MMPLHSSIEKGGREDVVQCLLINGADIDGKDKVQYRLYNKIDEWMDG
jgi:hypothetical protein